MTKFLGKPDVLVQLDVESEECLKRIKDRNREMESSITFDYIDRLRDGYEEFVVGISERVPVIRLDWNKFQPTGDVLELIFKKLDCVEEVVD
jgi:deoxyadenosine/deoxycytidine kinase